MSGAAAPEGSAAGAPPLIRAAGWRDVAAVAAIETRAFSDPWSSDAFAGLVTNPQVYFGVAVDTARDGDVAGYVVAWFAADEAEVANLAVSPSRRGRGVGSLLLDRALNEAVRRGSSAVYLEVRESNRAARALYDSRGFAPVGRRRNYYRRPSEDAIVLRRDLTIR